MKYIIKLIPDTPESGINARNNQGLHNPCIFAISCLFIIFTLSLFRDTPSARAAVHHGIWLSYVDFEDAGLYNKTEEEFTDAAEYIFTNLETYGFNNVYFHVRAFDDAIYPGSSFDWCGYLSKKPLKYDTLSILIDAAHRHNIKFHAWINPYRITLDDIYDPSEESTTEHITAGVREIIENYDVDGIHFDDYFYPAAHKGNQFFKVSAKDRMNNVNKMIHTVYETIKSYDNNILFGISPAGNIEYAKSIGCDLDTWFSKEGYIDYIIPQLYWSDNYRIGGKKVKYFTQTLNEWTSLNTCNIPMYIGLALYKAGTRREEDPGWIKSGHNIADQLRAIKPYKCNGEVLFSYKYLFTPDGKKEAANYVRYISSLKISKTAISLKKGKKYNLAKQISVKKHFKTVFRYTSANKKIAAVTKTGIITARKKGRTRITVKGIAQSKVSFIVKVLSH